MKKLFVLAALLMATTAANAGNGISFEVQGHKIRIEAPKNCEQLSCLQISAPSLAAGLKGLKSKRSDANSDVAVSSDASPQKSAAAPAAPADQIMAAPQPPAAAA